MEPAPGFDFLSFLAFAQIGLPMCTTKLTGTDQIQGKRACQLFLVRFDLAGNGTFSCDLESKVRIPKGMDPRRTTSPIPL